MNAPDNSLELGELGQKILKTLLQQHAMSVSAYPETKALVEMFATAIDTLESSMPKLDNTVQPPKTARAAMQIGHNLTVQEVHDTLAKFKQSLTGMSEEGKL